MDSETSVDFNFNILDGNGKIPTPKNKNNDNTQNVENNPVKKPESSDTDFYLNLIANQNKLKDDSDLNSNATSSLSEIIESENSESDVEDDSESSRRSDSSRSNSSRSRNSSKASSSKSSKARYEKINLSPSNNKPNNTFIPAQHHEEQKKQLSPQEMRMKKIELLRRLSELKTKGYELSKSYDFNSSIEEMEYEYDLLKSFANKRNGIKLYKNILLNTVSAAEFLNDKYDPFEFELNGWSEHMSVEVDSYDDVLEELYEKYKGTGKKMPPEVKLLMLIIASASAFHFSKSTFKNLPGVEKVLQNNPDLIAKMMNPKKESSQFMSEQEINLERQKKTILEREKAKRNENRQPQQPMASFVNNNFSPFQVNQQPQQPVSQPTANIKAPLNVQDILNRLHNSENNSAASETQEETSSNNDRIVGTSSMNSSERRKGRKKKSIMTIS
jgi:hypothetical protein